MNKDLLEQAKGVASLAAKKGAKGVRVRLGRTRKSQVEWRDGKLDRLRESTRMGLGITLFVDGRYSSNSTSDLRPAAIEAFLDEAIAMTRVLSADEHRKLAEPERYGQGHDGDLKLFDDSGLKQITPEGRRKTAQDLEAAARAIPGADQIISVTSSCSDTCGESALVCSNGMEGQRESSVFSMSAETSVKDEGGRRPEGWWYDVARHRADLMSLEALGAEATRRALSLVGSKAEKSGEYPCVVENAVAARLLGGLMGPLNGRAIQQKRSFLADKLNQAVGSPRLHIIDDPFVKKGLGSRTYDSEGMSCRRRTVFAEGVLKTFFFDTYYASKLGEEPTTDSTSNLVFKPGSQDLAGLLAAMDRGIFITGFSGGNSNAATGDFSVGVRGHWVEKGQIVRPLTEMNLSGNHLSFWKKLAELGSDANRRSPWRSPSMRFEPVQFSGA